VAECPRPLGVLDGFGLEEQSGVAVQAKGS